jgi:hypothetical protein
MYRTLSSAVLGAAFMAALALPAVAETTVKVDVAGLSAPAAHAKIVEAAQAACRVELRDASRLEQYYLHSGCISDAIASAEAQLKATASVSDHAVLAGR